MADNQIPLLARLANEVRSKNQTPTVSDSAKSPLGLAELAQQIRQNNSVFKYNRHVLDSLKNEFPDKPGWQFPANDEYYEKEYNKWDNDIIKGARSKGGDPNLVKMIIFQEGRMNPKIPASSASAKGIPQTYEEIVSGINRNRGLTWENWEANPMPDFSNKPYTMDELQDNPYRASQFISDYIRDAKEKQNANSLEEILITYNASPSVLKAYREGKTIPKETQDYIKAIKATMTSLGISPDLSGKKTTSSKTIYQKPEAITQFKPDAELDELIDSGNIAAQTSLYNTNKNLVSDWNTKEGKVKSKSNEFEQKKQAIDASVNKDILNLNEQYSKEQSDAKLTLEADIKKLETDYKAKRKTIKTTAEFNALNKEMEAKQKDLVDKYNKQATLKFESYKKEYDSALEKGKKEAEKLHREADTIDLDEGNYFLDKKTGNNGEQRIREAIMRLPLDYESRKNGVQKLMQEMIKNAPDKEKAKKEFLAIANKELLYDNNGELTNYFYKNDAEINIVRLSKKWDALKKEYDSYISKYKNIVEKNPLLAAKVGSLKYEQAISNDPKANGMYMELTDISQAIDNYKKALSLPEPKTGDDKEGSFWQELGRDKNIADIFLGGTVKSIDDFNLMMAARQKYNQRDLTEGETALLNSNALLSVISEKLRPGFSRAYKVGEGTATSLPFLTSMIYGSGLYRGAKKGVEELVKWEAKKGFKNALKTALAESVGMAAIVPFQPTSYSKLFEYRTNLQPEISPEGLVGVAYEPEESFAKSLGKAAYSAWTENITEAMGDYMSPVLKKFLPKAYSYLGLGALNKLPKNMFSKAITWTKQTSHVNGLLPEFIEEYIGGIMGLPTGETKPKDLVNSDQWWTTFLSVATMVVPFGVVAKFAGARDATKIEDFLNQDQLSQLDGIMNIADISEKATKLREFIHQNDINDVESRKMVATYAWDKQTEQAEQVQQAPVDQQGEALYTYKGVPTTKEDILGFFDYATLEDINDPKKYTFPKDDPEIQKIIQQKQEEEGIEIPESPKLQAEQIKTDLSQFTQINQQIETVEGASKKKSLANQKQQLLSANPTIKFVDDNFAEVNRQLEQKGLLKIKC